MKILSLKKDKRHLVKVIFLDGSEILIDQDVCFDFALTPEMEIDEADIKRLKFESDYVRAKSRALWYLDRSDYTEKAIFEKLIKAGFQKEASAKAIARLIEIGAVDDRRFAERYFEHLTEKNLSKREIVSKMLLKGVDLSLAKEMVQDSECDDEQSKIIALLEGKYAYKLTLEGGKEKVFAALIRKGFSFSQVKTAMSKYFEDIEFSEEY
ncbi:MAG: RecX family transcriptional regulator [Clostridia bacterium]|nr:RecX family transcriptional regulator [Clostridia bacterium]